MIDIRRNIEKVYKNIDPFWGKYAELNNAIVPDIGMIQNFQLQKIQGFQKAMSERVAKKNKIINELFTSGNINYLINKNNQYEKESLDQAVTTIVNLLNSTYSGNKTKTNIEYNYQLLQNKLILLKDKLEQLNNIIVSNNGENIPAFYIDTLNEAIKACGITSLNPNILNNWFQHLNKFKGDLIEDIGVSWLSSLHIPNTLTLNTGALNYQGSQKYGRKGQLIQDLMTLEVSSYDLDTIKIEYKDVGGKFISTTLKEFISAMEKAKNQHKQIILQDSGYETLLNLSSLNIQAKSGINQLLWNESVSTSVSIREFDEKDNLVLSTKHAFELLHQLDQDNIPKKDIWVKNTSKDYNLMADYGLGTVLFKILHLEENGNDYVLTPQGFTTFTDRIETLMRKRNSRISLKEQVTINNNTLSTIYNVTMTNYRR